MSLLGVNYTGWKREGTLDAASGSRTPEDEDDLSKAFVDMEITFEGHKVNLNCSEDLAVIVDVLSEPSRESKRMKQTPLQVLIEAYTNMVPGGKPEKMEFSNKLPITTFHSQVRELRRRFAKWAMQCEEFANLPLEDKRKMFCNFWIYIYYTERVARADEFLKSECRPEHVLCEDGVVLDLSRIEFAIPGLADDAKRKQISDHFLLFGLNTLNDVVLPMRKLQLTTFEVVYMCLFKMMSISKIPDLSPQTYKTAKEVLDAASSELHTFYSRELKTKNYAVRVSKLFDVLTGLENTGRAWEATLLSADANKLFYSNSFDDEFNDFIKYV